MLYALDSLSRRIPSLVVGQVLPTHPCWAAAGQRAARSALWIDHHLRRRRSLALLEEELAAAMDAVPAFRVGEIDAAIES